MRTLDNKTARFLILSAMTSVLLTAFANCGTYSDDGVTVSSSAADLVCGNETCITPTVDNLAVKLNLGDSADFSVGPITDFNLGGDCNEGGFPFNTVVWELNYNGVKVRDSNMAGTAGSTANANSACKNGRFLLYVYLGAIAADNVNRTGLGGAAGYTLSVEIYGQSVPYGPSQRNPVTGRQTINLNPVTTSN